MGNKKIRFRRKIVVWGVVALGLLGLAFWAIWPGPLVRRVCILDYGNLRLSGRYESPLFQPKTPFLREVTVSGSSRAPILPQYSSLAVKHDGWTVILGECSIASLRRDGWAITEEGAAVAATQSGEWGNCTLGFSRGKLSHFSLRLTVDSTGVTLSYPPLGPHATIELPCHPDDITASFGSPDDRTEGILH